MSTKIDVIDGDLSFVVKKGKNLKLKNNDEVNYRVEITPDGFSEDDQSFPLNAGKMGEIKANGQKKSGRFQIRITPVEPPFPESGKRKDDDQIPPRMIIKVE